MYAVLKRLPREFVLEILAIGRWEERAYEVAEEITQGTFADLNLSYADPAILRKVISEIGRALHAFSEASLRHRDLRPANILVRARDPLDLVVIGFGSARLSEYDLDIVAPLETTRYMAPEAIAGGVAAASDWWSLGMIVLEGVTRGACFEGINEQAFLIHVVANGAPIPQGLDPSIEALLRGLLARDRAKRWQWEQVNRWIAGEQVDAPPWEQIEVTGRGPAIRLGNREYTDPRSYALAAGLQENWNIASEQLQRGEIATWVEEIKIDPRTRASLRETVRQQQISDDLKLAIALKLLNHAVPLIHRGEIINPGWLLAHPVEGFDLISGPVPDLLARFEMEGEEWLFQLKRRSQAVRSRAKSLEIALDEESLRIHLLARSRTQLATLWDEKRKVFPDTEHSGLISIIERGQITEEDLIVLVTALPSQFRSVSDIVDEAVTIARNSAVEEFDRAQATGLLSHPRRALFLEVDRRLEGFARSGVAAIDEWADQYRLEKRMPLARLLVLLAIPANRWEKPPKQQYVSQLIEFFAKKVAGTVLRGPLVRMTISKTAARVDLTELHRSRDGAAAILNHLLGRTDKSLSLDPSVLAGSETLERRIRALNAHSMLYRRDTGIDGLYLGFPFILLQDKRAQSKPRIAPVLLWPIRLTVEVGGRGNVKIAFDRDREEVRLNPAFDGLLGPDTVKNWRLVATELLQRSSITMGDVIDAFGTVAAANSQSIVALPSKEAKPKDGRSEIVCGAVLFHVTYVGQAIGEDLQKLRATFPSECALATLLKATEGVSQVASPPSVLEREKYLAVECDPSQEAAVLSARDGSGLLIEGPPGTGKSQTIVNVICDAIGRGKSLLVVCQKLPALEVVKKRLEAERLGDRIIMVTDTYKDRQNIIRAVRTQRQNLNGSDSEPAERLLQRRHSIATQVETLEKFVDAHHSALYRVDPEFGKSYRDVISDLIELEDGSPPPSAPALRQILSTLDQSGATEIENRIAPLARYWLPAKYEGSPLSILKTFSPDPVTVAAFLDVFDAFASAEKERLRVYENNSTPFHVDDDKPLQNWLRGEGKTIREIEQESLNTAALWMPLHRSVTGDGSKFQQLSNNLGNIESGLRSLSSGDEPLPFFDQLIELDGRELHEWLELATRVTTRTMALAKLWPPLYFKRWRLSRFIARLGYDLQTDRFESIRRALELETVMRASRAQFTKIEYTLCRGMSDVSRTTPQELVGLVRSLLTRIRRAALTFQGVDACPMRNNLDAAITAARCDQLDVLFEHFEAALARFHADQNSTGALGALEAWVDSDWTERLRKVIRQRKFDADAIESINAARNEISAYLIFRLRSQELDNRDLRILAILRKHHDALAQIHLDDLDPTIRSIIRRELLLAWKSKLEGSESTLIAAQQEIKTKIRQLEDAQQRMRAANQQLLVEYVDLNRISPLTSWEGITRLTGPRTLRLREFIDQGVDHGLMALRPVWLMNPDAASRVLPLKQGLFDIVVYDEASQMPVEYALPTLYRAKQATVSGDEKQMPPTSFFTSRVESDEAEIFDGEEVDEDATEEERQAFEETWNRREIKDCPDLLHLARSTLPSTTLKIHYRSAYRELIQFSNASFYSGRLSVPMRHPDDVIRNIRPIQVVRADGVYESQTNPKEAKLVVEVLAKIWKSSEQLPSLGVVTFNRKQADLIEELIEERAEHDSEFRRTYTKERERVDNGEDMGVFVKNVENVQGDERDIIIFSTTFGKSQTGAFRRFFGVLGQAGGERRLNVAITRARRKIILVTSMPIADVSDFLATHHAPSKPRDYLQAYLQYATLISSGDLDAAQHLAGRIMLNVPSKPADLRKHDAFARSVERYIRSLGLNPESIKVDDAFGFDFAVTDRRTGLYGIGIECDAPKHSLLMRARDREIWRPKILRKAVPHFYRVSSAAWYDEPEKERMRLKSAIDEALGEIQ